MSILSSTQSGIAKILETYKSYGINPNSVTFNNDGTINCTGDVVIMPWHVNKDGEMMLPFKIKRLKGSFDCSSIGLKTLKGSPEIVSLTFRCNDNELQDLKGGPHIVHGSYYCYRNKLTTLEGSPEIVERIFDCSNNCLHALSHGPKKVGTRYLCGVNQYLDINPDCFFT